LVVFLLSSWRLLGLLLDRRGVGRGCRRKRRSGDRRTGSCAGHESLSSPWIYCASPILS